MACWASSLTKRPERKGENGEKMRGHCTTCSESIRLCWILCSLFLFRPAFAQDDVFRRAAEGLEAHRKGTAVIQVMHPDGTPVSGVRVQVTLTRHDFRFGNLFRPRHYNDPVYRERFLELFNFVELLEFNWGQYEPDEGEPLLEERLRFIREWCWPNGINRFYGHMLVWSTQYGTYPKTALPLWLFQHPLEQHKALLQARIQREVHAYRDVDIIWDVVNEAVHARHWGDWEKPNYVQEPLERVIPLVRQALTWAHAANPQAKLLINDYDAIHANVYQQRYRQLLNALKDQRAPLSAVGIQAHEPYKGAYWYSPKELWHAFDLFGTSLGLPMYLTEFFYVSDPQQAIRGGYREGQWSPERQAEAIEEFYRISFGHPAVEAIIYFGMADNDVFRPSSGLLDNNFQPKPAWHRLLKLLREEWSTRAAGQTAADGTFRFRGFFGDYRVVIDLPEQSHIRHGKLKKGDANQWRFVVP